MTHIDTMIHDVSLKDSDDRSQIEKLIYQLGLAKEMASINTLAESLKVASEFLVQSKHASKPILEADKRLIESMLQAFNAGFKNIL